jgi:hypothetical protein
LPDATTRAARTPCQPQPGKARAAPAAHSHRLAASLSPATTATAGAARAVASWGDERCMSRSWAKRDDAFEWDECAAGAARALPGCGWQVVLATRWWRRATTRPDGTSVSLAHAAPALVFGGRLPPPTQVTCAQPRGFTRCTSARGPRRCPGERIATICARLCSAGTRRCLVLPRDRHLCTCVQRRARTQVDTRVTVGPPWSVWPDIPSRMVTKPG